MLNRVINIIIIISCSIFSGFFLYNYLLADKYTKYAIIFEEPMNGLLSGSQVLLNGIRIGKVISLQILKENTSKCLVVINAKNIKSHLIEAQLIYLGIAGNRGVNLLFKKTEEMLPRFDGLEQIKSTKSTFSKLLDSTESINKEQVESFVSSANEIAVSIKLAIDKISKLINSVNDLMIKSLPISEDILLFSKNLNKLSNKLLPVIIKISNEIENENQFDFKEILNNLSLFSDSIKKLSKKSELVLQEFSKKPIRFIIRGLHETSTESSREFFTPTKKVAPVKVVMRRIS